MISNGIRMGMKITFPFLSGAARENEKGVRGALNPTIYWVINFLVRIPFVSLSCSAFYSLWPTITQWDDIISEQA